MWMCMQFCHMLYKPPEKRRKKAIYWSLMITTLIADKSNTINAEGSVVICQSERGRHVRVIRWAQWGACGLTRVNILCESLPPSLSRSSYGCMLKATFLPSSIAFPAKWKIPKTFSEANSQNNVQFIWVLWKQDSTHPTKIFSIQRQGNG